jgi:hypothetical protein
MCVETVERSYFEPPPIRGILVTQKTAPGCSDLALDASYGNPSMTDRLRLEVTVAGGREIHAWPGASEFDLRPIDQIVNGPFSTGGFGTFLIEIFDNPGTHFTYLKESSSNGRTLFEYAYRVALEASHYHLGKAQRLSAHGGSFYIDRETHDVVHLAIETDPIPAETGMCRSRTSIEYHRVPIAAGDLLLPIESNLQIYEPGAILSEARTTFAACHEYGAQSSIRFDDDDSGSAPLKHASGQETAPAGIHFTIRTTAPIDLKTAAAGDRISAKVTQTSNSKTLPDGSVVSGRLTAVRHFIRQGHYQVTMTFDTATVKNVPLKLSAAIDRRQIELKRVQGSMRSRGTEIEIPPAGSGLQEGSFAIRDDLKVVKAGAELQWVTVR